jgi:hypothetical protein
VNILKAGLIQRQSRPCGPPAAAPGPVLERGYAACHRKLGRHFPDSAANSENSVTFYKKSETTPNQKASNVSGE